MPEHAGDADADAVKITDIPLSQLTPLHSIEKVTEEDVRHALSPRFHRFAPAIAATFNGEKVQHEEISAASLSHEAQVARAAQEAQPQARQQQDQPAQPQAQPAQPVNWAAQWEQLQAKKKAKTQVNEADYVPLPPSVFEAPYQFLQPEGWVPPEVFYEIEVPEEDADSAEAGDAAGADLEDQYGVEPEPEEDDDIRHPVRIWWSPLEHEPDEQVLYRVVAEDKVMNASPDDGETLQITQGTAYRDDNPGASGLRHYAIWAYKGHDLAEIAMAQPVFMGEVAVVYPPSNVKVSTIQGAIQVSWDLLPGHSNAVVYACKDNAKDPLSTQYEQMVDDSGRKATIPVQEAGQTMIISLQGQAEFRGDSVQSNDKLAVQRSIKLASELEKMELVGCERSVVNGHDHITVRWTSPKTGEVKIYFTPTAPPAEFRTRAVTKTYVEDALASAISETRGATEAGSEQSTTVPWPSEWYEVYVTPVNFNEADAWVGESKVLQRVQSIGEDQCRLIERVDSQLITFDWPKGAKAVEYSTNREQDQIREEDYDLQGGIRLHLDQHGDTVRLRPYAIFAGKRTEGEERVIPYGGLRAVTYDFEFDPQQGTAAVYLWSIGNGDKRPFSCQVVYRADRLPLYAEDGEALDIAFSNQQQKTYVAQGLGSVREQQPHFSVELGQRALHGGYIRLFAVEDYASGLESSFESFGGGDAFSAFSSFGEEEAQSDASDTYKPGDQAVVVEKYVSYKLQLQPHLFAQAQYYQGGQ